MKARKARKITDKEFFAILRENAGLYARTARAIVAQFKIPYTRQAVRARAEKHPDVVADIEEENFDIAEEGLHSLMRSKAENVRFKSIEFFLKTKGRKRGYVERKEHEHSIEGITANTDWLDGKKPKS